MTGQNKYIRTRSGKNHNNVNSRDNTGEVRKIIETCEIKITWSITGKKQKSNKSYTTLTVWYLEEQNNQVTTETKPKAE